MSALPVRLVALDAWGTVVNYVGPEMAEKKLWVRQPLLEALTYLGANLGTPDEFEAVYRTVKNHTERLSELTGRHIGYVERAIILAMAMGLPAYKANSTEIRSAAVTFKQRMESILPDALDPELPGSLKLLHEAGIRTALVSNLGAITARYMRRSFSAHGLEVDLEFYSDVTGLCKPNPALLGLVCETADVAPGEVLFIGDNANADYRGPRAFGMQAVRIGSTEPDVELAAPTVTAALRLMGLVP